MGNQGILVSLPTAARVFSSSKHPDQQWGPPRVLFTKYQGVLPRDKIAGL